MRTTWIHACLSKILTTTLVVLVLPTLLTNTANAYTPEQQLYLDTKKALDSKQMVYLLQATLLNHYSK